MTTTSAELLRMLGSVATPAQAQAGAKPSGLDFASLLKQASQSGSGIPITIGKSAGVKLTGEQLSRIGAAADLAESQGATRALVLIDGKALKLDVAVRQITGQAELASGGVLTGIDSVVSVPSDGKAAAAVPLPRAGFASPSLLRLLGGHPSDAADPAA